MTNVTEEMNTKPNRIFGIRHVQAALLFLALGLCFAIKINTSMAIVAMTDPNTKDYFDWDTGTQSVILSSFFWGYIVLQIPAGELARRYGGKLLLTIALTINAAACLLIPIGATYGGWMLVCACRVIQGLSQGVLFPSVHSLIGSWAPSEEISRFTSFAYSGCHLGSALQQIASGYISYSWGWQGIFYTNGVLAAVWVTMYIILGSDSPQHSKMISLEEKIYIQTSLGHIDGKKRLKTPWKDIFTSLPFICLIIVHCGENWGFWTLAMELPSYISHVLGVNLKENGVLSALPYLLEYLVSIVLGFVSDYIIKKQWLKIETSRKLSNSIAHFGPAIALIGMSFVPTGNVTLVITFLTLAVTLNAGIFTGFMVVHIDMAPNFAGVLMGVSSGIGNIVSLIVPLVTAAIVPDQTNAKDWQNVFYLAAGVYAGGNLIFLIFGTSERQKWNDIEESTDTESVEYKK